MTPRTFDVAVVGAGVFGAWCAYELARAGADVLLIDTYGPANSRASSGGESRIIRMGYGTDEIYSRSAQRSLVRWQQLFQETGSQELFVPTGVLWLARDNDRYCAGVERTLQAIGAQFNRLEKSELVARYPQLEFRSVTWGILEHGGGVLLARRAVQALVEHAKHNGVSYLNDAVLPPAAPSGILSALSTTSGSNLSARQFVFACGPWLPKLFPALLSELIHVTRQEVFFFGTPTGNDAFGPTKLPAWVDFNDLVYGVPNVDGRGFKIAIDAHGNKFDPDQGDRMASAEGLKAVRRYLEENIPLLSTAPVLESRVCQYENTSHGDFLIDRHPDWENVWLVGGGSGHGFKHGPAVGEYVGGLLAGSGTIEPRFAFGTKRKVQDRKVF